MLQYLSVLYFQRRAFQKFTFDFIFYLGYYLVFRVLQSCLSDGVSLSRFCAIAVGGTVWCQADATESPGRAQSRAPHIVVGLVELRLVK